MLKIYSGILLILSIISLVLVLHGYASGIKKLTGKSAVTGKIYDGDTIAVYVDGHFQKVRMIGIDSPELDQSPWGKNSMKCIESLISASGFIVFLEYDLEQRDKYGRILAYIWGRDGKMMNEEMLEKGCAVLFTIPPNIKYVEKFRAAQKKAQEHKAGLWGENGLKESPYDYRKKHPL